MQQKEETLDRKTEQYERKDEELSRRLAKVATTQEEVSDIKRAQLEMLEKISGMSTDEAKGIFAEKCGVRSAARNRHEDQGGSDRS